VTPLAAPGRLSAAGLLPAVLPGEADGDDVAPDAAGVAAHAHALAAVAAALHLRWDCFALGPTSLAVARAVAAAVPLGSQTGAAMTPAALVLVDRTADLLTPAQPSDALLERLLEGRPCEEAVVGTTLRAAAGPGDGFAAALGLPPLASLRSSDDAWEAAVGRRCRDAAMSARKGVLEAMRSEGKAPAVKPRLGAVAPAELLSLAAQLGAAVEPAPVEPVAKEPVAEELPTERSQYTQEQKTFYSKNTGNKNIYLMGQFSKSQNTPFLRWVAEKWPEIYNEAFEMHKKNVAKTADEPAANEPAADEEMSAADEELPAADDDDKMS
jgi:hypothetical protein